jgi:hypothetical protein
MPDILGYWDRWADRWYYPRGYSDLSAFEKWVERTFNRGPKRGDKQKYEEWKAKIGAGVRKTRELEEAVFVCWEESEAGWGTRPDGCSLHLSVEDSQRYIKDYWKRMPKQVPDEYSRPASSSQKVLVSRSIYGKIKRATKSRPYGLRLFEDELNKLEKEKQLRFPKNRIGWVPVRR